MPQTDAATLKRRMYHAAVPALAETLRAIVRTDWQDVDTAPEAEHFLDLAELVLDLAHDPDVRPAS